MNARKKDFAHNAGTWRELCSYISLLLCPSTVVKEGSSKNHEVVLVIKLLKQAMQI